MIAWAVLRNYKGSEWLTVYPRYTRKAVRKVAEAQRKADRNDLAHYSTHKVMVQILPNCRCGLVDDIQVTCARHSK